MENSIAFSTVIGETNMTWLWPFISGLWDKMKDILNCDMTRWACLSIWLVSIRMLYPFSFTHEFPYMLTAQWKGKCNIHISTLCSQLWLVYIAINMNSTIIHLLFYAGYPGVSCTIILEGPWSTWVWRSWRIIFVFKHLQSRTIIIMPNFM